ncbi:MAG: hypothetical protein OXH34_05435 [Bacteroidetes bacterium]|nr:hypothetical protein [Bacteroidota bacterium]
MDNKKLETKVFTCLTLQQRQVLERRAQSLGMSLSAFLRGLITNSKQTAKETLAREWVSVALQLQKLQSDGRENAEIQTILEKLKQLIQRTTSGRNTD